MVFTAEQPIDVDVIGVGYNVDDEFERKRKIQTMSINMTTNALTPTTIPITTVSNLVKFCRRSFVVRPKIPFKPGENGFLLEGTSNMISGVMRWCNDDNVVVVV